MNLISAFKEVVNKIIKKDQICNHIINKKYSLEGVLEDIRLPQCKRIKAHMVGIMLSHQTCHLKDVSRNTLQEMCHKACNSRFKELLNIDKCIITCHNSCKLQRLVMLRSLKPCDGDDNKVSYNADNMTIKMIEASTNTKLKIS